MKCDAAFKFGAAACFPKGPSKSVLAFVPLCRHFVDDDMGVEFIDAVQHGPGLVGQRLGKLIK